MELTKRQRQIVDTLAKTGGTDKQIAAALGISHNTVKSHMENIYRRIGCNNRVQAALWAR